MYFIVLYCISYGSWEVKKGTVTEAAPGPVSMIAGFNNIIMSYCVYKGGSES